MRTILAFQPTATSSHSGPPRSRTREDSAVLTENLRLTMATAGHDLRQPLQIILGAVERLGKLASDDTDRMWLNAARHQVSRLSDGLEDLTDAARRPRDDRPSPELQTVRVGSLLSKVAAEFAPAAADRGLRLRFVDCAAIISTDPELLVCALRNLVSNGLKYTRRGGVVIGCRRRRGLLFIDVVDSGMGISSDDCRHLRRIPPSRCAGGRHRAGSLPGAHQLHCARPSPRLRVRPRSRIPVQHPGRCGFRIERIAIDVQPSLSRQDHPRPSRSAAANPSHGSR